jgi:chitodextrinase
MTTFSDKRNRVVALMSAGLALALSACGGSSPEPAVKCETIAPAVTDLTAVAKSSSEIDLSWTAPDSKCALTYWVRRDSVLIDSTPDTSYADTGTGMDADTPPTPNTSYTYTVLVFNAAGISAPASVTATTLSDGGGGGGGGGGGSIGGGGGGSIGGGGGGSIGGGGGGSIGGGGGGSIGGGGGGGTPPDTTAPTAPTNLTATSITATSVVLNWSASTDNMGVISYQVYRGNTLVAEGGPASATISNLSAGTTYVFTVKAHDAAGNVATSTALTVTTASNGGGGGGGGVDVTPPSAPTNVMFSNLTTMSVTLSWTPSTDDVGVVAYDVYVGNTNLGTTTTKSVTLFNLTSGTTYNFNIKARDAAGNVSTGALITIAILAQGGGGGGGGGN